MLERELWTCPECGQRFVTANCSHSCGRFTLDGLFARSEPNVRAAYDAFEKMALKVAPFHVIPQKTRVSFQLRTRCAGGSPTKTFFKATFVLRTVVEHPRIARVDTYAADQNVHTVHLAKPEDVDDQVRQWLQMSTEYGEQIGRKER